MMRTVNSSEPLALSSIKIEMLETEAVLAVTGDVSFDKCRFETYKHLEFHVVSSSYSSVPTQI